MMVLMLLRMKNWTSKTWKVSKNFLNLISHTTESTVYLIQHFGMGV